MTNNETSQALIAAQQLVKSRQNYRNALQAVFYAVGIFGLLTVGAGIYTVLVPSGHSQSFWWWLGYGVEFVLGTLLVAGFGPHVGLESYIQAREEVAVEAYKQAAATRRQQN